MTNQLIRDRYVSDNVSTASPARLVTMLYDRLGRDLLSAEAAVSEGDVPRASNLLLHAQDIVWELASALDVNVWSGGPALMALYQFLLSELVDANIKKDRAKIAACRALVEPLADAWRRAAESLLGSGPMPAHSA